MSVRVRIVCSCLARALRAPTLTPGEREVLALVERHAMLHGYRARREHFAWAHAAWLWAARVRRVNRSSSVGLLTASGETP